MKKMMGGHKKSHSSAPSTKLFRQLSPSEILDYDQLNSEDFNKYDKIVKPGR
jgi:hypothetical protein